MTNTQFIPTLDSMAHYIPRTFCDVSEIEIADYAVKNQMNMLNFGHSGTGKSSFAQYIASLRNIPYYNVPSNDSLSASELQGSYVPDENGKLEWVDSQIVNLVRNGGILNLGEIDKLAKNAKHFVLPLLDFSRVITLLAHKGEVIKAHKDLLIIADYNPMYRGSQPLPEQLADRFEIKLHYDFDRSVESKYINSSSLLDLAYGMRSSSVGASASRSDSSTIFETPITSRILKTFEKISKELSYDLACEIFANNFTPEERPAVRMLLEGASYNIKEDLGIDVDAITTEHAKA